MLILKIYLGGNSCGCIKRNEIKIIASFTCLFTIHIYSLSVLGTNSQGTYYDPCFRNKERQAQRVLKHSDHRARVVDLDFMSHFPLHHVLRCLQGLKKSAINTAKHPVKECM